MRSKPRTKAERDEEILGEALRSGATLRLDWPLASRWPTFSDLVEESLRSINRRIASHAHRRKKREK